MTKSTSKMKTYLQMSLFFISSPPNPSLPGCPVFLDDITSYLTIVILCSPHVCPPVDRSSSSAYTTLTWSLESITSLPSTATVLFRRLILAHLCSGARVFLLLRWHGRYLSCGFPGAIHPNSTVPSP